jgi:hypothetical protein
MPRKNLDATQTVTPKKRISPVRITMEVVATRVNANGTLSGLEIVSATSPGTDVYATSHNQSGGSIWLKTSTLKGIEVMSDVGANATKTAIKLF